SRVGMGELETCASVGRPGSDCAGCGFGVGVGLGAGAIDWAKAVPARADASTSVSPIRAGDHLRELRIFNGLEKITRSSRMPKPPPEPWPRTRQDHGGVPK